MICQNNKRISQEFGILNVVASLYCWEIVLEKLKKTIEFRLFYQHGRRAPGYIERHVPDTKLSPDEKNHLDFKQQLILKASRYWYHWNLMAEAKADKIVMIEDLNEELSNLCDLVGIPYQPGVLAEIPKDINALRYHISD